MAKSLSVLYVTSEVYPFIKVGGLADTSYSFTLAMRDFGHDIRVMLPKYGNVSERKNKIHEINRLKDIPIPVGKDAEPATVKSSSISNPRTKVQAYIATNGKYFDQKKTIYTDPKTGLDLEDNDERFIFFNRTVVETCLLLGWVPDIIHCNDWQTALVPAYLRQMYPAKFKKTKIVFTIHDFGKQGVFPASTFEKTGFKKELKNMFIHKKQFNFMKAAIENADYITTVSPSYAQEILKDATYSDGLNKLLAEKSKIFKGLRHGIDAYQWNPKCDTDIYKKLENDFTAYKIENKKQLLKEAGLKYIPGTPVFGIVTKLTETKGIPELIEVADKLLKENLQIVMIGDGDKEMKKKIKKLATKFSNKFSYRDEYNERFAHQITAGSDFFLQPNNYAPTGLNSLYALNCGTIPVVRKTGAFKDLIAQYDIKTKEGNGLLYEQNTPADMLKTIKTALSIYNDIENWNRLIDNALNGDYSWSETVQAFDEIYRNLQKEG
jgi:starch synthase